MLPYTLSFITARTFKAKLHLINNCLINYFPFGSCMGLALHSPNACAQPNTFWMSHLIAGLRSLSLPFCSFVEKAATAAPPPPSGPMD